jgi:phenylalanyl-tRNA synthetase beta chain
VIVSLDGSERKLAPDMLIIADGRRPVAIAGVMGGMDSEITVDTSTVLLEAACFNPRSIRRTSAALKMRTEASVRFERGLSRELPVYALKRVTQLIVEIAGGKAAKGLIDVYRGAPVSEKKMLLDAARIQQLLGMKVAPARIEEALKALGFAVEKMPEGVFVTPPWWRTDIMYTADLAEEVARIIGYDQIPVTQLSAPIPVQEPSPRQVLREKMRDAMVGCGFQEAVSYTLTNEAVLSKLSPGCQLVGPSPAKVSNPLSQEQDALRTSLRANLIAALARNEKYEENGIRLFEIGKVFLPGEKGLPEEEEWLCAVLGGPRSPLSWRGQSKPMDFYDARGVVEELLGRLGLVADLAPVTDATLHEGRAASVTCGGRRIGVIGELHPKVAGQFEVSRPTYLIEISLEELLLVTAAAKRFQPIPRFPAVVRDIAIILDQTVKWEHIARIVTQFPLAVRCQPFDLYQGPPVPAGQKSLAFRVIYQSPAHTLKDEEVDGVHKAILGKLAKDIGAVLRS